MKYKVLVKFGTQEKDAIIELNESIGSKLVKKGILSEEKAKPKQPSKPKKENIKTK